MTLGPCGLDEAARARGPHERLHEIPAFAPTAVGRDHATDTQCRQVGAHALGPSVVSVGSAGSELDDGVLLELDVLREFSKRDGEESDPPWLGAVEANPGDAHRFPRLPPDDRIGLDGDQSGDRLPPWLVRDAEVGNPGGKRARLAHGPPALCTSRKQHPSETTAAWSDRAGNRASAPVRRTPGLRRGALGSRGRARHNDSARHQPSGVSNLRMRFSLTGPSVPSCCANSDTRSSSISHRTSARSAARTGSAGPWAYAARARW